MEMNNIGVNLPKKSNWLLKFVKAEGDADG